MSADEMLALVAGSHAAIWGILTAIVVCVVVVGILKKHRAMLEVDGDAGQETFLARIVARFPAWLCVLLLVVAALLGITPQSSVVEEVREGSGKIDAMFLIDFSGSMWGPSSYSYGRTADGTTPVDCVDAAGIVRIRFGGRNLDCLAVLILEHQLLLHPGANVGVVVFGDASIVLAPTREREALMEAVWTSRARTRENGFPSGTNIRIALSEAWKMLREHQSKDAPIIILSDLGDADPRAFQGLLLMLKNNGARIFAFGTGADGFSKRYIEAVLGPNTVIFVADRSDFSNIVMPIPITQAAPVTSFDPPVAGGDPRMLAAAAALTAAIFIGSFFLRPIRFVERWHDVV